MTAIKISTLSTYGHYREVVSLLGHLEQNKQLEILVSKKEIAIHSVPKSNLHIMKPGHPIIKPLTSLGHRYQVTLI